jgi:signal transduction histidine kinase/drug/metabolite transporter superfamily protein YnfA
MATDVEASAVAAEAIRLVARVRGSLALTSALHELAQRALDAHVSVVLQAGPTGEFRVTSASGLDGSPLDAWLSTRRAAEAAGRAIAADGPVFLERLASEIPEIARSLDAASGVIAPLALRDGAPGLLLIGFKDDTPTVDLSTVSVLAEAFTLGLDRTRAEHESDLERDLRGLVPTAAGQSYPAIGPALQGVCRSLAWLLGADAAELWQHDRATRELVLVAASDGRPPGERVPVADQESIAARGLRLTGPEIFRRADLTGPPPDIAAPLKGRRRALGTLVLHGVHMDSMSASDLIARVEQIAHGLATTLENAQLLDDVLRSRQEVRDLADRLARSEKMLALGQFVAGVAHELNNPLQGVIGHLELMRASGRLPPDLARDTALVHREAERAARIVTNLLLFAGSGRLRARRISLNGVVTRVLRVRASALKAAHIDVTRDLAEPSPQVNADPILLQQAILNVVMNAEQAIGSSGHLSIASRVDTAAGLATIVIEDSGPGLADDVRARVFEPFFTTKEVGQGTGMGLAIAFGIVRAHEGTIEADNHSGGGARFTITLPAQFTRHKMERAAT